VPVPRRFDRQPPERDQTRINERIRVPEVRLIDETGQQVGIIPTREALRIAQERDLDLVEVAPDAKPPVVRILDYSKYKYEQVQKQKAARKHQQQINVREIKFRPKIAQHDYDTKKGHVMRFLKARDKVKVTIMFRGREMAHPERGEMILNRLAEELAELAVVEQRPQQDGRNMTMMLAPSRQAAEASPAPDGGEASGGRNGGGRSSGSRRDRAAAEKAAEAAAAPRPKSEPEPETDAEPEPEADAEAAPEAAAEPAPAAEAAEEGGEDRSAAAG
jgi:translation initiation factor IF-3